MQRLFLVDMAVLENKTAVLADNQHGSLEMERIRKALPLKK